MAFIYETTNIVNGKKYIGKYEGPENDGYLGSGKLLTRSIKKYGESNFKRRIIESNLNKENVSEREKYWISKFNAVDSSKYYNISAGGDGGNTFAGFKGKEREKLISKLKQRKNVGKHLINKKTVSAIDILTGTKLQVSKKEFKKRRYVGSNCKGLWVTPFGNFTKLEDVKKFVPIDLYSISKKCKNNTMRIYKGHLQAVDESSEYYNHISDNLGKTFKEAGWGFMPIGLLIKKLKKKRSKDEV